MNPYEGAVPLEHAGRRVSLRFSWGVIASLQAEWGEGYGDRVGLAVDQRKLDDLAVLISRAGDMPVADVMAWSPPIMETVSAVSAAWAAAWLGVGGVEKAKEAAGEAANPRTALSMLSKLLSRVRSGQVSAGPNSGPTRQPQPASS